MLRAFAPILQYRSKVPKWFLIGQGKISQSQGKRAIQKGPVKPAATARPCGEGWAAHAAVHPASSDTSTHSPSRYNTSSYHNNPGSCITCSYRSELPSLCCSPYIVAGARLVLVLEGSPLFASCFQSQMYLVVWSPTPPSQAKPLLRIRLLAPLNLNTITKLEREDLLRRRHRHRDWANEPLIQNWPCW